MKWMRIIACFCFIQQTGGLSAQANAMNADVSFEFYYGDITLQPLSDSAWVIVEESIIINACRFYVSGVRLLQDGAIVWQEQSVYHLVDATIPHSMHFELNVPDHLAFSDVSFNLGIDSLTNVQGALGGNLDPTQGMYWAWQSGYINLKLEGQKRKADGQMQDFQFHLGGYQFPYNSCRRIMLSTNSQRMHVKMNLKQLFDTLDLELLHHVMSPGTEAMQISDHASHIFSIE